MINFTSKNILRFIKKFSDFGNQKDELLWARLQRDCVDSGGLEWKMKCKFEHDGTCCNSGTFRFKDSCVPENCGYCAPMSHGDAFRTSSDEDLVRFLSSVVSPMDCPRRVWNLYDSVLSYQDAWLKWLQEPCE